MSMQYDKISIEVDHATAELLIRLGDLLRLEQYRQLQSAQQLFTRLSNKVEQAAQDVKNLKERKGLRAV
jgi:hypothetical protein